MIRTAIASAALVASAYAAGDAIVINKCSYDVHMSNVPASGGGYSSIDKVLSSGSSYSQPWTELSNGNGWSIKLSKTAGAFGDNILQYEYTFHDDGTIWFDLSEVNGNPWDKNWEITATNGCSPRQAAYRYATDDAYGMQSCDDNASITVTVCSGENGGPGSAPPTESSSPAETWPATSAAPAPTSAPAETSTPEHHGGHHTWGFSDAGDVEAPAAKMAVAKEKVNEKPTTLATTALPNGAAVTVTNVHMETVTRYVTATHAPAAKRHAHHPRHHR